MSTLHRIRLYHATLAVSALLAYLSGDFGILHAWIGYGVATVIVLRLLWALSGDRMVGLMRFYPSFEGLRFDNAFTHPAISKSLMLGIAVSLTMATGTGILIDRGKSVGLADASVVAAAYADDDLHDDAARDAGEEESFLGEVHELFANLMLLCVAMHVSYLLLFKRPLARFMLFVPAPPPRRK